LQFVRNLSTVSCVRALFGLPLLAGLTACQIVAHLDQPLQRPDAGSAADGAVADGAPVESVSEAYAKVVLEDRPRVYYRFDEASGVVAVDSSGNHNDGTLSDSARWGAAGALADGSGKAVQLTDRNALVSLPKSIELAGNVAYTVEVWVFVENGENSGRIFEKIDPRAPSVEGTTAFFHPPDPNSVTLGFERWHQPDLVAASHQFNFSLARNAYTHFVIKRTGVGPDPTTTPAQFGGEFKGRLDEAALYDHALSEARVVHHFKVGKHIN
jgi:hypothetical protein